MLQVVIIGSGNVAQHLIKAFANNANAKIVQAFARHPQDLEHLLPATAITSSYDTITEADVYIIAVKDDAIAHVSSQLPFTGRLVLHTSGSSGLEHLDNKNWRGVFYPLQTFSKNKEIDFSIVPLCLESEQESDYQTLENLAKGLSKSIYSIDSEQRKALHVAAVFVSNFTNHMYTIGGEICSQNNIPFSILRPLIRETADKINTLSPKEAQTGPAIRHDRQTIQKHLDFLEKENHKELYTLITQSIQQTNE